MSKIRGLFQKSGVRHADYMISKLGREEDGKLVIAACTNNWDGLNSCSILEPYMLLYNITGEQRYLDFAEYIISFGGTLHANLFDLAYEDKTPIFQYHVTKAYEMISCFEGLAEYVKVTGNEYYREAVIRFGRRVLREEGAYPIENRTGIWTWELIDDLSLKEEAETVPCLSSVKIPLKNGEKLTLVDYPSAGQEYGHKVSAWIKLK